MIDRWLLVQAVEQERGRPRVPRRQRQRGHGQAEQEDLHGHAPQSVQLRSVAANRRRVDQVERRRR